MLGWGRGFTDLHLLNAVHANTCFQVFYTKSPEHVRQVHGIAVQPGASLQRVGRARFQILCLSLLIGVITEFLRAAVSLLPKRGNTYTIGLS